MGEPAAAVIPIEKIKTDTFSMDYFKFGKGERVFVIIPGLSVQGVMSAAQAVADQYARLTDAFTVYVFDPPHDLPSSYTPADMAKDLETAFGILGLERICLMGASMGGMAAMHIAADRPDLIERVILASTCVNVTEEAFRVIDHWIDLAKEGDAEGVYLSFGEAVYPKQVFATLKDPLVAAAGTVTKEELDHFLILAEGMRGFDSRSQLAKIKAPIFVVGDKEDHVFGAAAIETIFDLLRDRPNATLHSYDGYGHAACDTAPDFIVRAAQFLS